MWQALQFMSEQPTMIVHTLLGTVLPRLDVRGSDVTAVRVMCANENA